MPEPEKPFSSERHPSPEGPLPRVLTVDDIMHVQKHFQDLQEESRAKHADFIPSAQNLYDILTEGDDTPETEPSADEHAFDKTINTLLEAWGERHGLPAGSAPKTLEEARQLFIDNPGLNTKTPIHFQGSADQISGRFVHVLTGRTIGKPRETATRRYYLNPSADHMGYVVEQLTGAALQAEVPLHFKFVNVATPTHDHRTLTRNDRIVIYASDKQADFVSPLLKNIADTIPEAFKGRTVAGFGEIVTDGITMSDEVSQEQNERFKGYSDGTSFNDLRTKLIYEATMDVTRDLISLPDFSSIKIGDHTISQLFLSRLNKQLGNDKRDVSIQEDDPRFLYAIGTGLNLQQLKESGAYDSDALNAIERTIASVARDIIPAITPNSLLPGYQKHIKELSSKYGIDPYNLAKNIPLGDASEKQG